ncbi:MAG: hypothetical protein FH753_16635 [Firmicutes bacterium]|nr:hypothetical protein [Bacillota bacterium]
MTEEKINKMILNACREDAFKFEKFINGNKSIIYSGKKGQWSYLVEILIITIKSLYPSKKEVKVSINYDRFLKELNLWKYYRHGNNKSLINILTRNKESIYWQEDDESIFIRILAIVISNKKYENIKKEVIKNILFTTGNIKNLLEGIILSKVLFSLINKDDLDYEKLLKSLKEEIIHMSQRNFLNTNKDYFRFELSTYPGKYSLDFEREKINLLNILNGIKGKKFTNLIHTLEILKNKSCNENSSFFVNVIKGIYLEKEFKYVIKDEEFIKVLCKYLIKLRKGRVNPESLEVNEYNLPDIFAFKEGEEFNHTLLNRAIIIKKITYKNYLISYVKTKTGIYRFAKFKNTL